MRTPRKHSNSGRVWTAFLAVSALSASLVTAVALPATAAVQATYYVSPTGMGSTCSAAVPCALDSARDVVRTQNSSMTGDIRVVLADGVYSRSAPFELEESGTVHDSGTNGYDVIYAAAAGATPTISGGVAVTGWSTYGSSGLYRANVGTSFDTKQLYVNGVRATLARSELWPTGFSVSTSASTPTITTTNPAYTGMSTWLNPSRIGVVGQDVWKMFECPVASISGGTLTMQNPCFTNAVTQDAPDYSWHTVAYIENALELLDESGEWYYDRTGGYMYYKPRTGESMSTANVIAPRLESVVSAQGAAGHPLHNIVLEGIEFAHTTWMQPLEAQGMASRQANVIFETNGSTVSLANIPAAVTFRHTHDVSVTSSSFHQLGATGLMFVDGSHNNVVSWNTFSDISGGAVHIGDIDNEASTDTSLDGPMAIDNEISNNVVTNTGVDYWQTVGIFGGYNDSLVVRNNEINDLPYTGISIGWGWNFWAYQTATPWAKDNVVARNQVWDVTKKVSDGAGIYLLGHAPGSQVTENYVFNIHHMSWTHGLYFDNGTSASIADDNVVQNISGYFLFINNPAWSPAYNNSGSGNFTNSSTNIGPSGDGYGNTVTGTTVVSTTWPPAAVSIMDAAGLEVTATPPCVTPSPQIEAESLTSLSGAVNYGTVVGDFDNADWIRYSSVDFGSGRDHASFRLGTGTPGQDIQIRLGSPTGTLVGTLTVTDTGGYGVHDTQCLSIAPTSGLQDVYLVGSGVAGIANIDWFGFWTNGIAATTQIEAESLGALSGVTNFGTVVGDFDNGDWMRYNSINFGAGGLTTASFRLATGTGGQDIQIRLGSPTGSLIGTLTVAGTGGYGAHTTQNTSISSTSGVHDVYLVGVGVAGIANVDWFTFQ